MICPYCRTKSKPCKDFNKKGYMFYKHYVCKLGTHYFTKKWGDKMNLEELQSIANEQGVRVSDLPDEFVAEITGTREETDRYDTKILIATFNIDGRELEISYKPMHVQALIDALKKINVNEFKGRFKFKKTQFEIGYPRPLPVEQIIK